MQAAGRGILAVLVEFLEHPLPSGDRAVPRYAGVVLAGDGADVFGGDADRGGRPGDLSAAIGVLVAGREDRLALGPPFAVLGASPVGEDDLQRLVVGWPGGGPRPGLRPPLLRFHNSDSSSNIVSGLTRAASPRPALG